eukprot:7960883-Alexandrium_andersonii.AAC.1
MCIRDSYHRSPHEHYVHEGPALMDKPQHWRGGAQVGPGGRNPAGKYAGLALATGYTLVATTHSLQANSRAPGEAAP